MMRLASFGFSSRYFAKTSPTALLTMPSISGIVQADFRLRLELRVGQRDIDHGGQPVAIIFAFGLESLNCFSFSP